MHNSFSFLIINLIYVANEMKLSNSFTNGMYQENFFNLQCIKPGKRFVSRPYVVIHTIKLII